MNRYKVVVRVFNGIERATFIIFDRDIVKMIHLPAAQLIAQQSAPIDKIPKKIQNLSQQSFVLEIKSYNQRMW